MCDVCGVPREPETCVGCHDDFRVDGEDGHYLLRCAVGHQWWSQWRARSGSSPGGWKRPACTSCGLEPIEEE